MWILRFLSGPLSGQTIPLKKNSTLLGRAPGCDLKIPSSGVSKEHTRIEIMQDKLLISDTGSRNGTFLNGVQIRSAKAVPGDRISLHDVIIEVQNVPEQWALPPPGAQQFSYHGNAAHQMQHHQPQHAHQSMPEPDAQPQAQAMAQLVPQWIERATSVLDREILPGIYKLPEMFEFRWVLAGFMCLFIMLVTSLSTVPLIRILKVSIEEESHQHALTIANTLAKINRQAIMEGTESALTIDIAMSRPGVKKALIISALDGNILAPAAQAGTYPDLPYVHEGRKLGVESVKQIDDNTVMSLVPIEFYNAETGAQAITAYAVVIYDMGSIAIDNGEVLSLFISTLFISLLIGSLIFYFLYKTVEYPFRNLNQQLDSALKEGRDTVQVNYRFPALQTLTNNISSALTRALNGTEGVEKTVEHDRNREIINVIELIGFAAMGVRAHDLSIAAVNQAFEARGGMTVAQAASMTVNDINDQALKLSVKDLIDRVDKNPDELASNELEFSGHDFQVIAQAIFGSSKIAYYLIVLLPAEESE